MRTHLIAAPLVGFALVLAGCGGSDDDKGLSKADYIKQADAICQKGDDAQNKALQSALQALGTDSPSAEQQAKLASEIAVPNIENQLKEIKALGTPKESGDEAKALLTSLEDATAKVKADPSTIVNDGSGPSPFADANAKAKAFGLTVCGSDS
ncbi:hypothetical protein [Patulibacter minatonensis]|uniref:hypothetical protein n=1 Tax=Patulibacter minatonensis TaxID=298163 RepID=UPI00047E2C62|nr:hypothetical protein [Patulibacter minatonensis]